MNYSVNLSSGQTVEVVIGEAAQINVEQALNYIESGRVEITKYVNEWAKPEIANYTKEYAEPIVTEIVNQTTKPLIDDYLNTTTKPQIDEYVADNVKPYADSAKDSAAKAKISEDNAKTSETNAKASELAAASSAGVASAAAVTATEAKDYTANVLTDENLKTVGQDLQSADSNIKTVATNILNVNTVAKNIDNVNLLAPHTEAMEALAPDIMDVVTVAGITEQTKNVSENMTAVVDVSNNKTNINNVSVNMPFVEGVSENITNVVAVDRNKANIDNVASNKTNIINVAENITAVNNVSENMADVKEAVQSANDAKLWAVGTITEKPEGSSKYWAEKAQQAAQVYDATETVKGIVRLATSEEVTAGTNDSAAITPLKLKSKLDTKQDKSTAVNYDNISNCITELPQNTVELGGMTSHETLWVKGISYIPDGFESDGVTPKFIKYNGTNENHQNLYRYTGSYMFFVQNGFSGVKYLPVSYCYSGPTAPTEFFTSNNDKLALWYDTTNNLVKFTRNGGSTWKSGYSLPIYIATYSYEKSKFISIDQVFNGFGYIGSTIFALPGVKGLIPNGRNEDGSLKSIEILLDSVKTSTIPVGFTYKSINMGLTTDDVIDLNFFTYYEKENIIKNLQQSLVREVNCATLDVNNGIITSFTPKTVFHAIDYNDKSTISGWSMPSSRYIDLTLGASGSTYTAPANGYFSWYCYQNNNGYIFVQSSASLLPNRVANASNDIAGFIPVKKGDIVRVEYANLTFNRLRFIYAEGENS